MVQGLSQVPPILGSVPIGSSRRLEFDWWKLLGAVENAVWMLPRCWAWSMRGKGGDHPEWDNGRGRSSFSFHAILISNRHHRLRSECLTLPLGLRDLHLRGSSALMIAAVSLFPTRMTRVGVDTCCALPSKPHHHIRLCKLIVGIPRSRMSPAFNTNGSFLFLERGIGVL